MDDDKKLEDWFGQTLETPSTPMIDPGDGRAMMLECFEFAMKPNFLIPTKQMLFDSHWPQIRQLLWSKGLEANEDVQPRVVISKTRYRIFILCEVKGGRVREGKMKDKAKNLNEILTGKEK